MIITTFFFDYHKIFFKLSQRFFFNQFITTFFFLIIITFFLNYINISVNKLFRKTIVAFTINSQYCFANLLAIILQTCCEYNKYVNNKI